ncbi:GAF domain-containing sensor histidine kinase [Paenibacillus sediminis]|uniref:histidine kinase n=1 Tax=Paenibacillus sediminis TaxID=664909 RepID=A0ABS4H762_9BACL|nr:GAF domain-containing sensor histidine kinase [Paenibacillus sediminis]MBP1938077.1 signal transduction histidine kinase [Paenibacillus sediminis]
MEPRVQELITLKTIAETLNQSNRLTPMLGTVLEKLLELTELEAGWIFLIDDDQDYECVADYGLPPALMSDNKRPMRCGTCWCMDRYRKGKLKNAVNILNCKRLEDAVENHLGDTHGITHHATVPLRSGNRRIGILNVAAPGKEHFEEEELALLQAVAFQIGSAMERMRLYADEQRRADLFARLGEFSRMLGTSTESESDQLQLAQRVMELIGAHFDWPYAAIIESAHSDFIIRSVFSGTSTRKTCSRLTGPAAEWLEKSVRERRLVAASEIEASGLTSDQQEKVGAMPKLRSAYAVPVPMSGATTYVIVIGGIKAGDLKRMDGDVLEALAEHVAITFESARIEEYHRELARWDERNKLARDLHDSVSQMLFSLSMTAKGTETLLTGNDVESAITAVRDMKSLSQSALKEMRALIMQLRPVGLEAGLVTSLKTYGEKFGLRVIPMSKGIRDIPRSVEEGLWRIGQEALNNVCKHSGVTEAIVELELSETEAVLRVIDHGRGVVEPSPERIRASFGMSTMRERAEALGGKFTITSEYNHGTVVEVVIPL